MSQYIFRFISIFLPVFLFLLNTHFGKIVVKMGDFH